MPLVNESGPKAIGDRSLYGAVRCPKVTGRLIHRDRNVDRGIDKRIEYDLYYIQNWSVGLDLKIMWLTLLRGLQKHAY